MKIGLQVGPPGQAFSAPLRCQQSLFSALVDLNSGFDLVPVMGKLPDDLDLYHADNIPFSLYEWARLGRVPKAIAHAHGNLVWVYPELMEKSLPHRAVMRLVARIADRRIHAYIPVSNYMAQFLKSQGIDEGRIYPVYNGIDCRFFERSQYPPLFEQWPYLLHVSKYQPKKNTEAVVKAHRLLLNRFPDLHLVIAGEGHESWSKETKALAMWDRIHLLGRVSQVGLHRLYEHAECFVFPTLHETFGLPVAEAMATGCPVVTTRRGSVPEVGGDAVEYCEPDAASIAATVDDVISNIYRYVKLSTRATSRARRFTWERAAKDVLRVYEGVLG